MLVLKTHLFSSLNFFIFLYWTDSLVYDLHVFADLCLAVCFLGFYYVNGIVLLFLGRRASLTLSFDSNKIDMINFVVLYCIVPEGNLQLSYI